MRERAVRIGRPTPLVSIVSEPERMNTETPAVIILNSGVMHHIGTCRLSVKLARRLAENGILSCRFDFSGIGDSEPRRGNMPFEESAPMEVREVMDYLEDRKEVKRFVLYGLCSGADASYETALLDERVISIIQIDAYCYKTWKWWLIYYLPRVMKLGVWKRFISRRFSRNEQEPDNVIDNEFIEMPSYIRVFPPKESIEAGLEKLSDRHVYMYNIFTGGQEEILNYENQYRESFRSIDFEDRLRVDYLPEANHIITEPNYQRTVIENICAWVLSLSHKALPEHRH